MKVITTKITKIRLNLYYELTMAALALAVLVVLIIEFTRPLTEAQELLLTRIDLSILAIFAVDYFWRLLHATDKLAFFKSNVFDLIAIMPFDKAFRIARLARLTRLTRLTRATRVSKLARVLVITRKFTFNLKGILKTNGLQYVLLFTAVLIFLGTVSIFALEPNMNTFGDALWWSLVTATTVGYGDISPESPGGRIVAAILMLTGIGMIGMVTGSVATYFVSKLPDEDPDQRKTVVVEQIEYLKSKLNDLESLDENDLHHLIRLINGIWEENQLTKVDDRSA